MEFEPTTIEHLGLKLYVSLPPVIGELVSNSWDADADNVWVTLPTGSITEKSEIVVKDDGMGMDERAIQEAYLRIGRNCREVLGRETTKIKKRPMMGRKGIGKLSAFGVADELEVRTVHDGVAVCIRLNYEDMKNVPRGKAYEPKVIDSRSGPTKDHNGTEIRIRKLRRERGIDDDAVRRELARRYIVVGDDFKVFVNDRGVTPKDRRLKDDCRKAWDVTELPGGDAVDQSKN